MKMLKTKKFELGILKANSLKKKLMSIVLIIFLSLSVILVGLISTSTNKMVNTTLSVSMQETATAASDSVATMISGRGNLLNSYATWDLVYNYSGDLAALKAGLDPMTVSQGYTYYNLYNPEGKSVIDGSTILNKDWIDISKDKLYSVGQPIYTDSDNNPKTPPSVEIPYISPVVNKQGTFQGVIVAYDTNAELNKKCEASKVGDAGINYLLDSQGMCFAANKESYIGASSQGSDCDGTAIQALERDAMQGCQGYGQTEWEGFITYNAYAPVVDCGMSTVVSCSKAFFDEKIRTELMMIIGIIILILLVSIIVFAKLASDLSKSVKQAEEALEHFAKGDFKVADIETKDRTELGQMINTVNNVKHEVDDIITDLARLCTEMGNGNFNVQTEAKYNGGFLNIESSLKKLISEMSITLNQVMTSAEQVNIGSEQVSSAAQSLAQGSVEQSASIEQLSSNVQEIHKQIKENLKHVQLATDKSKLVDSELQSGQERMNEMMSAMTDIESKSNEISKIIKAIEDIAFQTNILALNAAVEAARAGSAGKGFAVVADEVRNLAQKSADAAKSTTALIEDTVSSVQSGSEIAKQTSDAMNLVVSSTSEVITSIGEISKVFEEQAESVEHITSSLDQISSVVQSNSATAEESAAASEELTGQATMLKEEVQKFEVKS